MYILSYEAITVRILIALTESDRITCKNEHNVCFSLVFEKIKFEDLSSILEHGLFRTGQD